jgi:hypothetical protein
LQEKYYCGAVEVLQIKLQLLHVHVLYFIDITSYMAIIIKFFVNCPINFLHALYDLRIKIGVQ